MGFILATDSNSEIPLDWVQTFDLHCLRMPYTLDGQIYEYDLGEKIDIPALFGELRKGNMPTTMMKNAVEIREFFEPFLQAGQDVLFFSFSSALSGNYACVCQVADELRAEYPQRKLLCVDTLSISMVEGQLVYRAAEMRRDGKTMEEIAAWVEQNRLRSNVLLTVDSLFHLKRGGRVSGATALVGTVLDIKPLLRIDREGRLVQDGKVQSRRKAISALVANLLERGEDLPSQEVTILHGDCLEEAELLKKMILERVQPAGVRIHLVGPVIGTHAGPGVLAVVYMGKERSA